MKEEWLKVTPETGTGDGVIAFSTEPYKGREKRNTSVSIEAEGCDPQVIEVEQQGFGEYIQFQETAEISSEGGELVLKGRSNSKKLTFSLGTGDIEIEIPESYLVGADKTTNNGVEIEGDPGASADYEFTLTLSIPANISSSTKTKEVKVVVEGGEEKVCTITQDFTEGQLSVSTNSVTLTANGDPVEVQVYSNTTWTVK